MISPYSKESEEVRNRKVERKGEIRNAHLEKARAILKKDENHLHRGTLAMVAGRSLVRRCCVLRKEEACHILSVFKITKDNKLMLRSRIPLRQASAQDCPAHKRSGNKGKKLDWFQITTQVYSAKASVVDKGYQFGALSPAVREEWKAIINNLRFEERGERPKNQKTVTPAAGTTSASTSGRGQDGVGDDNVVLGEGQRLEANLGGFVEEMLIEIDEDELQHNSEEEEEEEANDDALEALAGDLDIDDDHPFFNPFETPTASPSPASSRQSSVNYGPGFLSGGGSGKGGVSRLSSSNSAPNVPSSSSQTPYNFDYKRASLASAKSVSDASGCKPLPTPPSSAQQSQSQSQQQRASAQDTKSSNRKTMPPGELDRLSLQQEPAGRSSRRIVSSKPLTGKLGSALYPFNAVSADELTLLKGDTVLVTHMNESDDWWQGFNERTNSIGLFPKAYVKLID